MKQLFCIAVVIVCSVTVVSAQKESGPLPYNQDHLDSMFRTVPRQQLPFTTPSPEGSLRTLPVKPRTTNGFEEINPGASVINKTSRGTIYNMPLDNMAVLVPDRSKLEKMPVAPYRYMPSPSDPMPNPLFRPKQPRKNK